MIKIISLLTLLHTRGLGRAKIWKLIECYGSAEEVLKVGLDAQKKVLFNKWEVQNWEEDLERAEKEKIHLITYQDSRYPKNLLQIPDFPLLLYVKGELISGDNKSLALIGTRNATLYGKQMAEKIAKELVGAGIEVVSGLARGIDTAAHQGALEGKGRTLAVIGSGLSKLYPQENRYLADKIASSGAVISEFPMEMAPSKGLFPQRNRIVSGMSQGVCLIESPIKGGAMLTMGMGEMQKKPLFAIPGRLDWPTFEGNHALLKQKRAHFFERGADLLDYFQFPQTQEIKIYPVLTQEEQAFFSKLPAEEKSIEELVLLTQLPIMQLNVFLTRLVLKKVVKEFPGKTYKKLIDG